MALLALSVPAAQARPDCSSANADGSYNVGEHWKKYIPRGLEVGDKFRLLWRTNFKVRAAWTTIANYNKTIGLDVGDVYGADCKNKHKALVSTQTTVARENTKTKSTHLSAPIYWPTGNKIADNYADFYDGTWDSMDQRYWNGYNFGGTRLKVWTGSNSDGTTHDDFYAGASRVMVGGTGNGDDPIESQDDDDQSQPPWRTLQKPLYGITPVFTIVESPKLSLELDPESRAEGSSGSKYVKVKLKLAPKRDEATKFKLCVLGKSTARFRTFIDSEKADFDLVGYNSDTKLKVDANNCHAYTIGANSGESSVRLRIIADRDSESDETAVLQIKEAPEGVIIKDGTQTHTIVDDDSLPHAAIYGADAVTESETYDFQIRPSVPFDTDTTVKVKVTETSSHVLSSYLSADQVKTYDVLVKADTDDATLSIGLLDDFRAEPAGGMRAEILEGSGYYIREGYGTKDVTINDDDTRGINTPSKLAVREGGSAKFGLNLKSMPHSSHFLERVTVTITAPAGLSVSPSKVDFGEDAEHFWSPSKVDFGEDAEHFWSGHPRATRRLSRESNRGLQPGRRCGEVTAAGAGEAVGSLACRGTRPGAWPEPRSASVTDGAV